jgi:hypothetical protein
MEAIAGIDDEGGQRDVTGFELLQRRGAVEAFRQIQIDKARGQPLHRILAATLPFPRIRADEELGTISGVVVGPIAGLL